MQYELRSLQKTLGITTIVVTHDQTEALVMSDQMIVLNQGGVEQIGAPPEIYGRPCNEFVASFIGEANLLKGIIETDSGGHWFRQSPSVRFPLPPDVSAPSRAAVTYIVRPEVVSLSGPPAKDAVRLEGRVVEAGFVGDAVRLKVDLGLPEPLIAKLLNKPGEAPPREGDTVSLAWAIKDASIIQH
jgi:putative spermidine/putrescine transport system ATP-binding protein